jgi:hypothetical protein
MAQNVGGVKGRVQLVDKLFYFFELRTTLKDARAEKSANFGRARRNPLPEARRIQPIARL